MATSGCHNVIIVPKDAQGIEVKKKFWGVKKRWKSQKGGNLKTDLFWDTGKERCLF